MESWHGVLRSSIIGCENLSLYLRGQNVGGISGKQRFRHFSWRTPSYKCGTFKTSLTYFPQGNGIKFKRYVQVPTRLMCDGAFKSRVQYCNVMTRSGRRWASASLSNMCLLLYLGLVMSSLMVIFIITSCTATFCLGVVSEKKSL